MWYYSGMWTWTTTTRVFTSNHHHPTTTTPPNDDDDDSDESDHQCTATTNSRNTTSILNDDNEKRAGLEMRIQALVCLFLSFLKKNALLTLKTRLRCVRTATTCNDDNHLSLVLVSTLYPPASHYTTVAESKQTTKWGEGCDIGSYIRKKVKTYVGWPGIGSHRYCRIIGYPFLYIGHR